MALQLPPGLTPPETAFLCEMELVTIVPRQRLEGLQLLGGPLPPLNPPQRTAVPLWLALLLKKQRRANIIAPPWLSAPALAQILEREKTSASFSAPPSLPPSLSSAAASSPPFLPSATASAPDDALPYHWLELGTLLLEAAGDDIPGSDLVRRLMRDLREVRMAKLRAGVSVLEGGREVGMTGVGGMEVAEGRAFIGGVIDGLRKIGASKELARREREEEEREGGGGGGGGGGGRENDGYDDDDDL